MLFDEPLSNLDAKLRARRRAWRSDRIQQQLGFHRDLRHPMTQEECFAISDKVAID